MTTTPKTGGTSMRWLLTENCGGNYNILDGKKSKGAGEGN